MVSDAPQIYLRHAALILTRGDTCVWQQEDQLKKIERSWRGAQPDAHSTFRQIMVANFK